MKKEIPWTNVVMDTREYTVYKDGFPVTEGHLLFVPKTETWEHLEKCYKAAYAWDPPGAVNPSWGAKGVPR